MKPDSRSFTLAELLVVLTIILILFALAMGAYFRAGDMARAVKTQALMSKVMIALTEYREIYNAYPGVYNEGGQFRDILAVYLEEAEFPADRFTSLKWSDPVPDNLSTAEWDTASNLADAFDIPFGDDYYPQPLVYIPPADAHRAGGAYLLYSLGLNGNSGTADDLYARETVEE
ncbi:MAG: prepilin-type N-terminal cleavage/methylation domain-containing protein [Planctomycetota bacterium]